MSKVTNNGLGLPSILFIIFLILKLTETISWSWWWITAPLWIPAVFFVFVIIVIFLGKNIY